MATMNKPCYAAIKELSPVKPTLIFVASRRQTRLTAFDIISYAASDERPKMFLGCDETYVEAIVDKVHDEALRHTIAFGIGLHHAGLSSHDRDIVEKMFLDGYIKVLVATATLAWGVNLPAHLVIVKGTYAASHNFYRNPLRAAANHCCYLQEQNILTESHHDTSTIPLQMYVHLREVSVHFTCRINVYFIFLSGLANDWKSRPSRF
jgi:hypothetical protein